MCAWGRGSGVSVNCGGTRRRSRNLGARFPTNWTSRDSLWTPAQPYPSQLTRQRQIATDITNMRVSWPPFATHISKKPPVPTLQKK